MVQWTQRKCVEPMIANWRFFVATISYCPGHSSGRKVNAICGQPPLVFGFHATLRPELCLFCSSDR